MLDSGHEFSFYVRAMRHSAQIILDRPSQRGKYMPTWVLACTSCWFAGTAGASEIAINCDQELQRIDGFGASTFGGFELFERGHFDDVVPEGVTYHTTPE